MALAIFLCALLVRLPGAVLVPQAGVYNVDELMMVRTVLGLPAGITPPSLQWPAGLPIFLLTGLAGAIFLATDPSAMGALFSLDPGALLSAYFGHVGRTVLDPVPLLVAGRLLLALLAAAAAPLLFLTTRKFLDLPGRLVASLLVALSPALLAETAVIKGDALAMTFWVPAVFLLAGSLVTVPGDQGTDGARGREILLAAALAGLAACCRFLYLLAIVPILLVAMTSRGGCPCAGPGRRIAHVAAVLAAFLVPLLFFVPWIWTRPLGLAKSVLGNAMFLSSVVPVFQGKWLLLALLAGLTGLGGLCLVPFGVNRLWIRIGLPALFALGVVMLTFFLPVASSNYVELRYLVPLLPMLVLLAGAGFDHLFGDSEATSSRRLPGVRWVVLFLVVVSAALPVFRWWRTIRAPDPVTDVIRWLDDMAPAGVPIYLAPEFAGHVRPDADSVERSLALYESGRSKGSPRADAILRLMGKSGGDLHHSLVEAVFGEDEAMDRFILGCIRQSYRSGSISGGVEVRWYQRIPDKPDQVPTAELAAAVGREGRALVVVSGEVPLAPGAEARFSAGRWTVHEYGGAGNVE